MKESAPYLVVEAHQTLPTHYYCHLLKDLAVFSAVFCHVWGTWTPHEVGVGSSAIMGYASGSGGPMGERISAISGRKGSLEYFIRGHLFVAC